MDQSSLQNLLEAAGGVAFAVENDCLTLCTPEAEALGLVRGERFASHFPDVALPGPDEAAGEAELRLKHRDWSLRAVRTEAGLLCFLRPLPDRIPGPTDNTLLHTAGCIRDALQDVTVALDRLTDVLPDEGPVPLQAASALRGVYRLRRTAGDLELFAKLREGSYPLARRKASAVAEAIELCSTLSELLAVSGVRLASSIPRSGLNRVMDWELIAALLRCMVANAAANTADGLVRLSLRASGLDGLCYTVENRPARPLPEAAFHRHAAVREDAEKGLGLGLSLIAAGAAALGGSFLLSIEAGGRLSAILTVRNGPESSKALHQLRPELPRGGEAALIALSELLPVEAYWPVDIL